MPRRSFSTSMFVIVSTVVTVGCGSRTDADRSTLASADRPVWQRFVDDARGREETRMVLRVDDSTEGDVRGLDFYETDVPGRSRCADPEGGPLSPSSTELASCGTDGIGALGERFADATESAGPVIDGHATVAETIVTPSVSGRPHRVTGERLLLDAETAFPVREEILIGPDIVIRAVGYARVPPVSP